MTHVVQRSVLAEKLIYLDGRPFSLDEYQPFRAVYDSEQPVIVLKTGRQVGKSVNIEELITLADGSLKRAGDICVKDRVACLDLKTHKMTSSAVSHVIGPYKKKCVLLTTRLGYTLVVAETHPLRMWDAWTPAKELKVGSRVAVARRLGDFGTHAQYADAELALLGFLLGDGYLAGKQAAFTKANQVVLAEYQRCLTESGLSFSVVKPSSGRKAFSVRSKMPEVIIKEGLVGTKSATKFIPNFVFQLDRRRTSLFLNRLWCTDGHVKKTGKGRYDISYSSMSALLIRQVQRLLAKFNIPSNIRKKWPNIYKNRGEEVYGYELRIESQPGIKVFLTEIGALTKSENVELPTVIARSNRDTYPLGVNALLEKIYGHKVGSKDPSRKDALHANNQGLRLSLKYAPSQAKIASYLEFFRDCGKDDSPAYRELQNHFDGDVIWDSIVGIDPVGIKTCVDFTVKKHSNFVVGGVITHNSTSLTSFMLTGGISIPQFKTLFIAPSKEQTSRFSNTRFAKAIFFSPMIKKYFVTNAMPANNVTLRMLANGSEFFFSYAREDAERCRGISADLLVMDEVQSIVLEAVDPVVRECLAASSYKQRMYCGTPLSAENDIEVMLWQNSNCCEWVVSCQETGCGANNVLGLKNIGPKHLICARCEKGPLDVRRGRWYETNPHGHMAGFRIPQISLHRNVGTDFAYKSILEKLRDYSKAQFNNEVLGVSDSLGARLIGIDNIKALCKDYQWWETGVNPDSLLHVTQVVAGIDWGGQSPTNVSRTTIGIFGILPNDKLRLLYAKIYPSGHAMHDLDDIARICDLYAVRLIVADSGEGMLANATLRAKLGDHRVLGNRYGGMDGHIKWNENVNAPGYHSDKTMLVDQVMHGVLTKEFEFPHWDQFLPFTDDIMAAYEEQTPQGRRIWRHAATRPDDFLHSCVFAWLAAKVLTGQVAMYQKSKSDSDGD